MKMTDANKAKIQSNVAKLVSYAAQKAGTSIEDVIEALKQSVNEIDTSNPVTELEVADAVINIVEAVAETTDTKIDDELAALLNKGLDIAEGETRPFVGGVQIFAGVVHFVKTIKGEKATATEAAQTATAETPAAE
jgi:hypothetical protein